MITGTYSIRSRILRRCRPSVVVVLAACLALDGLCADVAVREFGAVPNDGVGDGRMRLGGLLRHYYREGA
jgi:hypothetical protein